MRDILEAIEQLSTLLAMRIEKAAGRRGWACKAQTRSSAPTRGRFLQLVSTTVSLPGGQAASFVPRPEADAAGLWHIDVRRSDGVMRRSWQGGLQVGRAGQKGDAYAVLSGGAPLSDEAIDALLDDLSKPAPSGVSLWVRKVWAIRFGRMPVDLSDLLESVRDADRLDQMHAAVLRAVDEADAAAMLRAIGKG